MTKDKAIRRLEIPVCENIYGAMTKVELMEAQDKEHNLAQQDRTVEQTKEKKNSLESYVYEMRNKVKTLDLNHKCHFFTFMSTSSMC